LGTPASAAKVDKGIGGIVLGRGGGVDPVGRGAVKTGRGTGGVFPASGVVSTVGAGAVTLGSTRSSAGGMTKRRDFLRDIGGCVERAGSVRRLVVKAGPSTIGTTGALAL